MQRKPPKWDPFFSRGPTSYPEKRPRIGWLRGVVLVSRASSCGWTKSCTTWKPWETVVCWYVQVYHHSRVSWVRNGLVHPQYFFSPREQCLVEYAWQMFSAVAYLHYHFIAHRERRAPRFSLRYCMPVHHVRVNRPFREGSKGGFQGGSGAVGDTPFFSGYTFD